MRVDSTLTAPLMTHFRDLDATLQQGPAQASPGGLRHQKQTRNFATVRINEAQQYAILLRNECPVFRDDVFVIGGGSISHPVRKLVTAIMRFT